MHEDRREVEERGKKREQGSNEHGIVENMACRTLIGHVSIV